MSRPRSRVTNCALARVVMIFRGSRRWSRQPISTSPYSSPTTDKAAARHPRQPKRRHPRMPATRTPVWAVQHCKDHNMGFLDELKDKARSSGIRQRRD